MISIPDLIKLFGLVPVSPDSVKLPPAVVNEVALRAGYFVEPDACTTEVFTVMHDLAVNYNTTFYAQVQDVLSRTPLQRLVDQLMHYASTYGTNFTAPVFTRNPEPAAMLYKQLKVVKAATREEFFEQCLRLVNGPALKPETMTVACNYITDFILYKKGFDKVDFDIAAIGNREAKCLLYRDLKVVPEDPFDFLRLAVFCATESTLLINSEETLDKIKHYAKESNECVALFASDLTEKQLAGLAGIFFRFKHLFIAFKKSFKTPFGSRQQMRAGVLINKLRRMASKMKRPFEGDVLGRVLEGHWDAERVAKAASAERSTFRLVRLLGYLHMMEQAPTAAFYMIRNGKTFIKAIEGRKDDVRGRIATYATLIEAEIVKRLKAKVEGKTVLYPEGLKLAAPTSEKSFVGNVPFMSSYDFGKINSFIGIYWRNKWGTRDFDLSGVFPDTGTKVGWNTGMTLEDNSVVYSGDMTDADPEATEVLFFGPNVPDGFIYVNRFYGEQGSLYRLFFGVGVPQECSKKTMAGLICSARKQDVRVEADMVSDSEQQLVGYISAGQFFFMGRGLGRSIVSSASKTYPLREALNFRRYSAVNLRSLLEKAGAVAVEGDKADIDLRVYALNRASLINLFD